MATGTVVASRTLLPARLQSRPPRRGARGTFGCWPKAPRVRLVWAHIKDFEKASKDAKDPDVRAYATKTLPVRHKHLQRAEELEKSMKGNKS